MYYVCYTKQFENEYIVTVVSYCYIADFYIIMCNFKIPNDMQRYDMQQNTKAYKTYKRIKIQYCFFV